LANSDVRGVLAHPDSPHSRGGWLEVVPDRLDESHCGAGACLRHAAQLRAEVIHEYVEPGRTATNAQRPALQRMLADCGLATSSSTTFAVRPR
jgi:hypothetical protein